MTTIPTAAELESLAVSPAEAADLAAHIARLWAEPDAARRWAALTAEVLTPHLPAAVHRELFARNYAGWDELRGPAPAWSPTDEHIRTSNLRRMMDHIGARDVEAFARWAVEDPGRFWLALVRELGIRFEQPPERGAEPSAGRGAPRWLPGARLNIALSCFQKSGDAPALIASGETGRVRTLTSDELKAECHRFAGALARHGIKPGESVALILPLTLEGVVAYLGTILAGAVAVCIADSFAAAEVERRVRIAGARLIVTQDVVVRGGKSLALYERLASAALPPMVVTSAGDGDALRLRKEDVSWDAFFEGAEEAAPKIGDAADICTVLFSSGTTADPKAILWPQTPPIKCAADGFLYQDIRPSDVVTWPTSMGWMMGPWLIFAGLINRATVALFDGHPASKEFVEFVERSGVTVLGVIPSLVTAWSSSGVWHAADWSHVRLLSSTGECSEPEQMLALMARCGYKPVIEYCGGTEIGGGYVTSTVMRPIAPSRFNQAAFGLELRPFDAAGQPASRGEVFLSGTAMGLSTELLGGDHHATYYDGAPVDASGVALRRHGDEIELLAGGYYRVLGRADDAMNLGGIKVAAVEIEQVLVRHPDVEAAAAVATSDPAGGPAQLAVFAVPRTSPRDAAEVQKELQALLRSELNPLFRIVRLQWIDALPRTASNKVMRRLLRDRIENPRPAG